MDMPFMLLSRLCGSLIWSRGTAKMDGTEIWNHEIQHTDTGSNRPATVQNVAIDPAIRDEWEGAWPRIWIAAVAHAGPDIDTRLFDEIRGTANGSSERADLLHRIIGPSWRDEFGDSAFDHDAYSTWSQSGMATHTAALPTRLEDDPERRDLPALIPAWHAA
ncbi:hypothetical protein E3T61_16670 [Cryobacterium lactosi]|uniref:Uncharacterized protein n=1 Tax=Cryobacterium lactosi TaxID=1259202 RepID=A0A4R9BJ44_9MICO|nr:hypothetical protein [Cryobacterium lactosi]TFD85765.1 hypothetical protein E3T61_16670 [Cryobacterium lactosi]